jgi:hypothetical protein
MAKGVEQLPSKYKALNSNPSTTKKKKRKKPQAKTYSKWWYNMICPSTNTYTTCKSKIQYGLGLR